jgi:chloramphenicol-sensitive protein RarD
MMNRGVFYGAAAYLMWGFFPIYFKALQMVPSLQIMMHRVLWSFLFVMLLILLRKEWPRFKESLSKSRILLTYTLTAVLLAANWLIYIYGVNSGQVVETSLGYFINPLLSVALGVIILRERLRPLQWIPIGLASSGVIYLTLQYGSPPWIALALAFSFGMYGLIKKIAPLGSLHGHLGWNVTILLALVGVITALPLLLFGMAARSIPLSLLGILQYIAPTVQFLLGIFLFQEPFSITLLIGYAIIWLALIIFTIEGALERRKRIASTPIA